MVDITGAISGLLGAMPNATEIGQQLALGAAVGVITSGIKAQVANGGLDPLGLRGLLPGSAPTSNQPVPASVGGPTITASAFSALSPASQASLAAAGVHIVAG